MNIYDDMEQALALEVDMVSGQGNLIYTSPGSEGDPFTPPTPGQDYPVKGWNITGSTRNKYIDGGFIVTSDLLLAIVPFGVKPEMGGTVSVNGVVHQIIMIDGATIDPEHPVVWRVGLRK